MTTTAGTDSADELERLGDPRLDIALAVLFLATTDARYITGQTVGVDGGSLLHA